MVQHVVERVRGKVQYSCHFEQHLLLRHSEQRAQLLSHNVAGLLDDSVESVNVPDPQTAAPADNRIHDGTGHHRLIEHPQAHPADVKGPQLP